MNETNTTSVQNFPIGVQDFATIRQKGLCYVDKTDQIYELTHTSFYAYLGRPRGVGKSLLCSTLQYYFEGRRDLFQGLAIAELEKEWTAYPVIHLTPTIRALPGRCFPTRRS